MTSYPNLVAEEDRAAFDHLHRQDEAEANRAEQEGAHAGFCPLTLCTGNCSNCLAADYARRKRIADQGVEAGLYLQRGGDRL